MSIIGEEPERRVRMAHLAVVGAAAVNGVAELHSRLLVETTLHDFAQLWPAKFRNVTNGVSPRRFVRLANPALAELISDGLGGDGWIKDLHQLTGLERLAADPAFRERWRSIKRQNKVALGLGDPDALADVMVKRFHEYKRQQLKLLHVITLYHRIKNDPDFAPVPRTVLFAGKAAPAYHAAKDIIRLINAVATTIDGGSGRHAVPEGCLSAQLQRRVGRVDHSGRRPERADLDGRQGGVRHREHEAGAQRRGHDRHPGRRERRDLRPGRGGQLLPVRARRGAGAGAAGRRLSAA